MMNNLQQQQFNKLQSQLQNKFPFMEFIGEYKHAHSKVRVRCNDCGEEWDVNPFAIIRSVHGCRKCKLKAAAVARAKERFLKTFDTENWELLDFQDHMHVKIRCKKCGYIRFTNAANIERFGCQQCATRRICGSNIDEFTERANKIHNFKYDYSQVDYINEHTKVIINCPIHGAFLQTPNKHLNGKQGCPKCAGKNRTKKELIQQLHKKHNNYYNYSKLEYKTVYDKVTIICPKHGEFTQQLACHIAGHGCYKCQRSHGEVIVASVLDLLNITYSEQFRINNTYNNGLHSAFVADFYFVHNNQKYIIEFNGQQHYMPIERFGGEIHFKKQLKRDEELRQYCKESNINLLEINYDNNDIKNTITSFINCRSLEQSNELLQTQNGEDCNVNTVVT